MKNRFGSYIFVILVPTFVLILMGIIFPVSDYLIVVLSVIMYGIFSYFCLDKRRTGKINSREKAIKNSVISILSIIFSVLILIFSKIFINFEFDKNIHMIIQIIMALLFSIGIMSLYLNIKYMVENLNKD